MPRKWPIFTVKHGLVNIMWTYLMTLDFSTDCGPSRKYGIEQRVPTCPENEALLIHTHCGLFHKATTIYVLFCPKKSTFLDKNVRKLGLQVCIFSHVCNYNSKFDFLWTAFHVSV